MNQVQSNNPFPPAAFAAVFGESPISKTDKARIVALCEAEARFHARRSELSPQALRLAARARVRQSAISGGELPDILDRSEETSRVALAALRERYDADFAEHRPFIASLYERLIERSRAFLAELAAQHQAEAERLGVAYIPCPTSRSVERAITMLERDLEMLNTRGVSFPVGQLLAKKLGIETKPAAKAEAELAAA